MATQYDAIIIGTGQAGPPLAQRMDREGLKVAVVERKLMGGTCVNVGCIPTKTLVASARVAHMARRSGDFGVLVDGPVGVDMKRVNARMKEISGQSNTNVTRWLDGMENVRVYHGHAHFESPNTVSVNGELLQAEKIFLNVGARARVPDMPGLAEVDYLTNTSMMEVDFLPDHLIIVGGSYIGLEFGQMYRRFGSEVTVVEMAPRLIQREDEDVTKIIHEVMEREGVRIRLNAECLRLKGRGDQVSIQVSCDEGPEEVTGTHILMAVGRVPNTGDLGLDGIGIEVDQRGFIPVDDQLRTTVTGIWALGDCNGRGAFTHTAYNDFEIVAANLFDDDSRRVSDRIPCYGLFIDPPLGRIGMTERQARESGRRVLVGKRPMKQVGRARERSETDGFIKVLVDGESKEILGAAILGINGDEVVHTLLALMYAGAPYTVLSRSVPIHPTVAELLPTVLQNLEPLG
ncbi:MAG: FAD-containing oxidoreductase [Acidobacteria bacterium]|nr:FAD-containing oxidoreductase [Acidobacteriota bacterium]